jgi:hypothetical protein
MAMQVCFEWRMDEIALFQLFKYILDDYAILCEVKKEEWITLLFTFLYANFGTLLQLVGTIVTYFCH